MKIMIINGPNLGRLDLRDSALYGDLSFSELATLVSERAVALGFEPTLYQSDSETEIIHWLHEAADTQTPVIMNPAAFTHYSYAIRDAVAMLTAPLIEVHLSNPMAREEFRHTSVISGVASGTIAGFGPNSYLLALEAMKVLVQK